jgi:hypothetical protein
MVKKKNELLWLCLAGDEVRKRVKIKTGLLRLRSQRRKGIKLD